MFINIVVDFKFFVRFDNGCILRLIWLIIIFIVVFKIFVKIINRMVMMSINCFFNEILKKNEMVIEIISSRVFCLNVVLFFMSYFSVLLEFKVVR